MEITITLTEEEAIILMIGLHQTMIAASLQGVGGLPMNDLVHNLHHLADSTNDVRVAELAAELSNRITAEMQEKELAAKARFN